MRLMNLKCAHSHYFTQSSKIAIRFLSCCSNNNIKCFSIRCTNIYNRAIRMKSKRKWMNQNERRFFTLFPFIYIDDVMEAPRISFSQQTIYRLKVSNIKSLKCHDRLKIIIELNCKDVMRENKKLHTKSFYLPVTLPFSSPFFTHCEPGQLKNKPAKRKNLLNDTSSLVV